MVSVDEAKVDKPLPSSEVRPLNQTKSASKGQTKRHIHGKDPRQ
jgi:hypothetical protein